jgi:hypothetical protein
MRKIIILIGLLIVMSCSFNTPTEPKERPISRREIQQPERNERNSDVQKDKVQED